MRLRVRVQDHSGRRPGGRDIRIEHNLAGLKAEIQQENRAADIRLVPLGTVPGLSPEGPRAALDLAQNLTGAAVEESVVYATEAGLFQRAGIDTVVCGPGNMSRGTPAANTSN